MPPDERPAVPSGIPGPGADDWRRAMRRELIARRAALPAEDCAALAARIRAWLDGAFASRLAGATVAFCWPVQNEPDLVPLATEWHARGIRLCLPVVVRPGTPLAFRRWWPEQPLYPDRYGIPTPTDGDFLTPRALLLPCNAFDARGYRIGYGGGYFDRTLAALDEAGASPLAIGVAYAFQELPDTRPQAHDRPLAALVTEHGVREPRGGAAV